MHAVARWDTANVHVGERLVQLRVRVDRCAPAELVRPARELAEALATIHAEERGTPPSCARGCDACCHHVAPVSPIEAVALADVVRRLPEEHRARVLARFAASLARLEEVGLVERGARGRSALVGESFDDAGTRYYAERLPCPFLEEHACSIYDARPAVCAEYVVTTPASWCAEMRPGVEALPRVFMSERLASVGHRIANAPDRLIPMVLALEWAEAHGARLRAPADGEEMAQHLLDTVASAQDDGSADG